LSESDPAKILPGNPEWQISGFWRFIAIAALSVIIAAGIINFLVDPFGIYGTGLIPRVAANTYEIKLDLFGNFDAPPEALIIGSSRSFPLDPAIVESITGKRCFNFSVPSAKTETFYAIINYAVVEKNAPVDTVIVSVDPESFHPTLPIQPESRFIPEYANYYIYHDAAIATFWERIALLFTLDQTTESISSLQRLFRTEAGIEWKEFTSNGLMKFNARETQIEEGSYNLQSRLDRRIRKYPERSLRLSEFTGICPVRQQYWEDFLFFCHEKDIYVFAFMPVEHPRLYSIMMEAGAAGIFSDVADYLRESVERYGGTFRNYTDISEFSGDPDQFYDEIHLRPLNAELLLYDLLGADAVVPDDP